jgi:spermidine synthase
MKDFFLYTAVAVSGAAVLALEILGTRILGPFYGVGLFLWSALITVTLAALSLGYLIGGRIADKNATLTHFCCIIGIAGAWIVLIPWLKNPFLSITEPLGLRQAVLAVAFILFFPPLTLLGMISPYAIKLRAESIEKVGRTAGNLYAISTLASVFSALLTGFYLIPNIGVNRLALIIGIVLMITAGYGLYRQKKRAIAGTAVIGIILALFFFWNAWAESAGPDSNLLTVRQSQYGEIRVIDIEGGRYLLIDGGIHSAVDTTTWTSITHYAAVMDLPKYFFERPGKALLIGLGGGSLLKQYAQDGWNVDAVEIDPTVIEIAYDYFGLSDKEGHIVEMDGRQFLGTTEDSYDVVLLDAFGSSSIPFHLVTEEVFGLIADHLTENGILAVNIETIGWDDPLIATLAATLTKQFANVVALPMEEPPDQLGNIVILASDRQLEPLRTPEDNATFDPYWRYGPGYQKVHAWDNRFIPDITGISALTDDLNPIDIRSEMINLEARKRLHVLFEEEDGINR